MSLSPLFRKELASVKTIVVKVGSRILTADGHEERVERLADDICALREFGARVALVSSGAIAHGMKALGLAKRPAEIHIQQACASIGQNRLMAAYQDLFGKRNILIGQVLLTWDDLRSKKRYLNLRNTLFQLLSCGAVPIINENDSVGVEEIRFGNNDTLGAQIALLSHADVFVNLTDVGGLYDKNPRVEACAKHIPVVGGGITQGVRKLADDQKSDISVGGMSTKLKAAEMVTKAGIPALIGDGFDARLLTVLKDESSATLFLPLERKMPSKRRWIAFAGQSVGSIVIDEGARRAIAEQGKSLLAAGITAVHGNFKVGDMVDIINDKNILARGLVNFSADDIEAIRGFKSADIKKKLGAIRFNEVILRDNLEVL